MTTPDVEAVARLLARRDGTVLLSGDYVAQAEEIIIALRQLVPPDLRRALTAGNHADLYHTSPEFHHDIDLLASWLPMWVDALARSAAIATQAREAMQHLAYQAPLASRQWRSFLRSAGHEVPHPYTPANSIASAGNDLPCCDRPEDDDIHVRPEQ